uniref:hypothetical protein n=1 Tax=Enterocloster aldenensis TaxID=358742 RepID=UPI0022E30920
MKDYLRFCLAVSVQWFWGRPARLLACDEPGAARRGYCHAMNLGPPGAVTAMR